MSVNGNFYSMSIRTLLAEIIVYEADVRALEGKTDGVSCLKRRRKLGRIARLKDELAAKAKKAGIQVEVPNLEHITMTDADTRIAALEAEVRALREQLNWMQSVVRKLAFKAGVLGPEDIPGPAAAANQIATQIAAKTAAGIDPIQQLREALVHQAAQGRVSWDMAIDHVPTALVQAATTFYGDTIGRSRGGGRSVEGFRQYVMGTTPEERAA